MKVPRWLFIPLILVGILYWSQDLWKGNNEPSIFDLPKTLEEKSFRIQVYPVSNVNNVPVFTTGKGGNEEDYLYLVPAPGNPEFPSDYLSKSDSGYVLQVNGKFYQGKGIPPAYLGTKPKPARLRVFQFDHAEMVAEKQNL
jgi:hypothetical protein